MSDKRVRWLIVEILVVLISWGVVPGLAKLGNLPGDVTTLYVNWIAVGAVAGIITVLRLWKKVLSYRRRDYAIMIGLGVVWPLIYSVAYFESINQGGPALTTVLNYTWPAFYLVAVRLLTGRRFGKLSILSVLLSIAAIAVTQILQAKGLAIALAPVLLGLLAAGTQGLFSAGTDEKWKYDPWVMTLIIEIVTAVGVTVLVVLRGSDVSVGGSALFYLAVIGAISNGIGFWAFLASNKLSAQISEFWKSTWLVAMCLVPVVQVVFLPLVGIPVSPYNWVGLGLVVAALMLHRFGGRASPSLPSEK
jgi:drug/metabolite transporter, DME family